MQIRGRWHVRVAFEAEIGGIDDIAIEQRHGTLKNIFQFPHIAGKGIG